MPRPSERLAACYFLYCCGCAALMNVRPGVPAVTFAVNAVVITGLFVAAWAEQLRHAKLPSTLRHWYMLPLMLLAYREMGWFAPYTHTFKSEKAWIAWDRVLLDQWGLRAAIESAGALLPSLLEMSYSSVYGIAPFCMGWLYYRRRTDRVEGFLLQFLASIYGSYVLNPFFPSEPPRTVFPGQDLPNILTIFREFNLGLLGNYGIHLSVFPSAHCSGAMGAALAMRRVLPEEPAIWRSLFVLALSIATATVYGRYHYAVDAVAGIGVALTVWIMIAGWRK